MPLDLGMAGKTFTVSAAGALRLTGETALLGSRLEIAAAEGADVALGPLSGAGALAKSGAGTATLTAQSPGFTGSLEITGGKVVSTQAAPFPQAAADAEIRIADGGTLDLGGPYAGNAVNYKNRKVVVSGAGVGGKGAIVAAFGDNVVQNNVFSDLELADDATVSVASGRMDVQTLNGIGRLALNGHTLAKLGGGNFAVSGATIVPGSTPAAIDVEEGQLLCEKATALAGAANRLQIGSGATFQIYNLAHPLEWTEAMAADAELDWTGAAPVLGFDRANATTGWGTYQVLAYRGYVWNRTSAPVTWTFCEHFDDGALVRIDGSVVLEYDISWNAPKRGPVVDLAPGCHAFEVRFAQLGGGAGPANQSTQAAWTPSTLAFGLDRTGGNSFDITRYDDLADIADGSLFTLAEEERAFDPNRLALLSGAGVTFNADAPTAMTYGPEITLEAEDVLAGRPLVFANASVTFAEGTTVTIPGLEEVDFTRVTAAKFVLVEAAALDGFDNVTFATPVPRGWRYCLEDGRRLVLARNGLLIYIR